MKKKKKILFSALYISDIGGISTSIVNLLNEIHDKYDITLVVLSNFISHNRKLPSGIKILKGSDFLYDVIPNRDWYRQQSIFKRVKRNLIRIINRFSYNPKRIEKALSKIKIDDEYDVAIAFTDFRYDNKQNKCYDYYLIKNNVKARIKVAWVHNNPQKLGWTKESVENELGKFDKIVNVSKGCKTIFDEIAPEFIDKSMVVYNTYDIDSIKEKSKAETLVYPINHKLHIVTVARMKIVQKRIDRVIEVCRRLVAENIINFDWTLVGEGGDLPFFKESVENLKLNDFIHFTGLQPNPFPYVKNADVFVQPSDYEGYGMTVKEAQILGVPTFITNYIASEEVVDDGVQGRICDNSTDGIYEVIKYAIQHPESLEKYKKNLIQNPVSNEVALKQFDDLCTNSSNIKVPE